ncbi:TadE/TadG family type IV pilus assembly protein [Oxalobacteraceae bacterium A2-2]
MKPARQRGIAAIELALIMTAIAFVVPLTVALGGMFRNYTVLQLSVNAAARYLASLPVAEIKSYDASDTAVEVVKSIVRDSAVDANLVVIPGRNATSVKCDSLLCSTSTAIPATVTVSQVLVIGAGNLPGLSYLTGASDGYTITITSTVPYGR